MAPIMQGQQPPVKMLPLQSNSRGSSVRRPETASGSSMYSHAEDEANGEATTCGRILIFLSWILVICTMPFSLLVCFKVVQEYERAVIFRLGRLMQGGAKGPGIFFILPCIDAYARVDLRTRTYDVPPQEVLTKDSVTVSVDAVVYYRVSNATISIANVENAHHSTRLLAQTTLRNTMGTRHLHEILSERMTISGTMQMQLDEVTEAWGIKVERVEIKDVRLPVQLQRAMAAEAEAAREARAKVIAAEGEQKASRALREASEVIGDSPAALQLRYLQVLTKDCVTVSVDAVVYYRVSNPTISITNIEHGHHSTRLLAQTTLRNTMGTKQLHEILSERLNISGNMRTQLDDVTEKWGIKIERVETKDVRLPIHLQRPMAAEAEASREARAKVIAAEGEQKAARALREAADVIGDSPVALQLRYLQTLNSISTEKNSTIVFPLPMDLLRNFMGEHANELPPIEV